MYKVFVNGELLKTPQGHSFQVPTFALAEAIEEEWKKDFSPYYQQKPLTALTATALDRVAGDRECYVTYGIEAVARDVVLFWAETPESLMTLQKEKWQPVIEEVNQSLNLSIKPIFSLMVDLLSASDEKKVWNFLKDQSHFTLVGFSHLVSLTSSFCLSYLLLQGKLTPEDGWDLAHLHEQAQRRIWGEDEDALAQEEGQRIEFLETLRFLRLGKLKEEQDIK